MNQTRRNKLQSSLELLSQAERTIEAVCDEERDSMENTPENLQSSDRYAAMERAVDYLEDAIESIQEATSSIDSAMNE